MKELPEQLARIKIDKQLNESGFICPYVFKRKIKRFSKFTIRSRF